MPDEPECPYCGAPPWMACDDAPEKGHPVAAQGGVASALTEVLAAHRHWEHIAGCSCGKLVLGADIHAALIPAVVEFCKTAPPTLVAELIGGEATGPEIAHAVEGQPVTVVFDGVFVRTDPETHGLVVKGNSRGAQHIDWTMEFHWATELYERREPTEGASQ